MAKLMTTWQQIAMPNLNTDTRGATAAFRSAREGFTDWQDAVDKRATNQALDALIGADGQVSRDNLEAVKGRPGVNYADLLTEVRNAEIGQRAAAAEQRAVETHADTRALSAEELIALKYANEIAPDVFKQESDLRAARTQANNLSGAVSQGTLEEQAYNRGVRGKVTSAVDDLTAQLRTADTTPWSGREPLYNEGLQAVLANHRDYHKGLSDTAYADQLKRDMPGIERNLNSKLDQMEDTYRAGLRNDVLRSFTSNPYVGEHPAMQDYRATEKIGAEAIAAQQASSAAETKKRGDFIRQAGGGAYTLVNGNAVPVTKGEWERNKMQVTDGAVKSLALQYLGSDSDEAQSLVRELANASGKDINVFKHVLGLHELGNDGGPLGFAYWKDGERRQNAIAAAGKLRDELTGRAKSELTGGPIGVAATPYDELLSALGQSNDRNTSAVINAEAKAAESAAALEAVTAELERARQTGAQPDRYRRRPRGS